MNRLFSAKPLLAAAVALGAIGAASTAQAHTDVVFSIGVPAYVEPAPVYVQQAPVYVEPAPVYVRPFGVYERPYRIAERRYYYEHERHHGREYGAWGDRDHDGVPNRFDRAPNNPYRR